MKAMALIEENVKIEYEIHYDEDELSCSGYCTLKEYIDDAFGGNMWDALVEGSVVKDISHNQILDYLNSDHGTLQFY